MECINYNTGDKDEGGEGRGLQHVSTARGKTYSVSIYVTMWSFFCSSSPPSSCFSRSSCFCSSCSCSSCSSCSCSPPPPPHPFLSPPPPPSSSSWSEMTIFSAWVCVCGCGCVCVCVGGGGGGGWSDRERKVECFNLLPFEMARWWLSMKL